MDNLSQLQDERKHLANKCKELDAKRDGGVFSDEARSEFSASKERIIEIDGKVEELREAADAAAFVAGLDANRDSVERDHHAKRSSGELSVADRQRAFVAKFCKPESLVSDEERSLISRVGNSKGSAQGLLSSAPKSIEEARNASFEGDQRAQSVGTNSEGGFTVPDEMMQAIEVALLAYGGVRENATVIRTATGADLPIPTVNDTSNKGAILAENTQVSDVDVTFGQLVLQSYKYSSKQVKASVELLQDSSINLPAFLGAALGERLGRILNEHFTTGTGTNQPNGIVTGSADSGVTTASNTAITRDELVSTMMSVDASYRRDGKWMISDTILQQILKLTDATNQPLWLPGQNGPIGDTILGAPYVINNDMPTGASAKAVLFGDLSKYIVREVVGMEFLQLNERYADYHQVGFLAFLRANGDLLNAGTNPVKYATLAA
jgi:HK97 family phage major capsid protein